MDQIQTISQKSANYTHMFQEPSLLGSQHPHTGAGIADDPIHYILQAHCATWLKQMQQRGSLPSDMDIAQKSTSSLPPNMWMHSI